jgi:hypothetical protein
MAFSKSSSEFSGTSHKDDDLQEDPEFWQENVKSH